MNDATDELVNLVGLEDFKKSVSTIGILKDYDTNLGEERFDIVFQGGKVQKMEKREWSEKLHAGVE